MSLQGKIEIKTIQRIIAPTFYVRSIDLDENMIRRNGTKSTLSINVSFPPFIYSSYDIQTKKSLRFVQRFESSNKKNRMQLLIIDKDMKVIHPSNIRIRINNETISTNCFGNIPKKGTAFIEGIDITDFLFMGKNIISVETLYDNTRVVLFEGLALTINQTINKLLHEIPHGKFVPDVDLDNDDVDDEIIEEQQVLSLRCPISFQTIEIPVRGKRCSHLRTFDMKSFIETAQKSGYYECPLCSEPIQPSDLIIDQQMESILKEMKDKPNVEEVVVTQDGQILPKVEENNESGDDEEELRLLKKGKEKREKEFEPFGDKPLQFKPNAPPPKETYYDRRITPIPNPFIPEKRGYLDLPNERRNELCSQQNQMPLYYVSPYNSTQSPRQGIPLTNPQHYPYNTSEYHQRVYNYQNSPNFYTPPPYIFPPDEQPLNYQLNTPYNYIGSSTNPHYRPIRAYQYPQRQYFIDEATKPHSIGSSNTYRNNFQNAIRTSNTNIFRNYDQPQQYDDTFTTTQNDDTLPNVTHSTRLETMGGSPDDPICL
ncbi:SP-RING zinc finger domain containing protein [Entamoeba histolytica HM-1:IMSS-B]|uniref:SP-RING zinc finger domain containing protein n=6 Tax=Entamoeba histolytica TaxID=5759 RepID=C4LWN5_ENTH1|nr:SP-RING zinc finger domain containing protein [Entamoeba histolytica HM-1:IMSS]EMD48411.1 zinc finger domain containing protein [Entamoeba histolytica KU27]EMH72413.1 SP-RING zinc finger domain containing protein [Entamoeba histolytica HM-1:IMSS-B]EMS14402.1 SP-RING zinc finger domain containing protein [Entamoeba histolytica HM-3:IMSS]ENY64397.1 SP-RING zinc finger domain containing protein [Entamoeba histolytica HM-1:IMSS-A]GAT93124.1 sp-ring zinc finger domain containing protein [Entamoe|eukprot:XP_648948.1 SP-RING zinc finger domain containing protein [Entamoeba histolytica HM-1:IMSS]